MHLFRLNNSRDTRVLCPLNESFFSDDLRLFLVGILGSSISILSVLQNVLLFYVFSTSRKLRRQNYVNPVLLAFFDSFVSLIYLLISPVHFLAHRLPSTSLATFWAHNMSFLYCLEHFALTVCNLLLVVASLERFLANGPLYSQKSVLVFIVRNKPYVIMTILTFAFLLKATLYFEIGLVQLPDCSDSGESVNMVPVWLADNASVFQALRFWTRNFLTVILPFLILAYCNCQIVQQLRKRRRMTMSAEYSGSMLTQTQAVNLVADSKHQRNILGIGEGKGTIPKVQLLPNDVTKTTSGLLEPTAIIRSIHNGHRGLQQRTRGRILKGQSGSSRDCRIEQHLSAKCANCLAKDISSSKHPNPTANKSNLTTSGTQCTSAATTATTTITPILSSPNSSFGVRVATRTLVMVVGCYLISNSMSTLLNFWEYFDLKFLRYDNFRAYLMASDVAALLTICGCALRLPIYVCNDKRIRKAICRALIRFRFCCTKSKPKEIARGQEAENFLEKYSIVIVSNSLRSNLTGMLSQFDWGTFQGKRSFDQLAILVQDRRKFLVQMTINLGAVHEVEEGDGIEEGRRGGEEGERTKRSGKEVEEEERKREEKKKEEREEEEEEEETISMMSE